MTNFCDPWWTSGIVINLERNDLSNAICCPKIKPSFGSFIDGEGIKGQQSKSLDNV